MPASVPTSLTGSLIRERRLALGLRQAEVAQSVGISASYLNLIEHNRRRTGPDVLARLAQVLGTEVATLAEGAGGALIDDLRAAAAAASAGQAELDRIEDFVGRFPGWAAVIAGQHRRTGQLERAVSALNDRLTHDPHLSASLHEVLSALASVRSTAAILADTEDIDPEWRERFHRNLHEDSERLAAGAESLVAYLDGSDTRLDAGFSAPQEEVEAWLAARGWHLTEVETPEGLASVQDEVAGLASAAARTLGAAFVQQATVEARRLPEAQLHQALRDMSGDPVRIAQHFGLGVLAVMRRMALSQGSRTGLMICDGSGTLLFRKPVEGFSMPRFGAACPLSPLFAALARPMAPLTTVVEMAGRVSRSFRTLAFCETRLPYGFAGPELREAGMLIFPEEPSGGQRAALVPVELGPSCRICPRESCPARREPSILTETAGTLAL